MSVVEQALDRAAPAKGRLKQSAWPSRRRRIKTPFVQQLEAVECGAAALGAILAYHKRWVPLVELRRQCGVSRDGSKAANVLRAARRYGLTAKGLSKGTQSIKGLKPPFIVFWEFNHFLVVEGFDREKVFLNDPAVGHRRVSWAQFDESFTGVVLAMEPGPEFEPGGTQPSLIKALWSRTIGSRQALLFILICGIINIVPGLAAAAYVRVLVDEVIVGTNVSWLRPIIVAMVVTLAFSLASLALSNLFTRRMAMAMAARLQGQYVRQLLKLPYHFFAQRYVGEVVARVAINDALVALIAGQLVAALVGVVTMVAFGLALLTYNPPLTLIGLTATVANFLLLRSVAERRMEANLAIAKERGKLDGITYSGIRSIETLKANGMENAFFEKWAGQFARTNIARQNLQVDNQVFAILPTVTNTLVNLLTMVIGALYVLEGEMSFGELMAFNALMALFLGPISQLLTLSVEIQQIRGNVARLDDVLSAETIDDRRKRLADASEDATAWDTTKGRLSGAVAVNDLAFGYQPLEPPLIEGLSFAIGPGDHVAFVGGSGSGKSTVAKLVAGLLEPRAGGITFDGCAAHTIDRETLAASIAFVDQDIHVFAGTIRDNLTLWDDTTPDEWLIDALRDAGLHDDVMERPGGLDTEVAEDGRNFSGGQRQRIELARALARRPSLIILDEATSGLDVVTEETVMARLRRRRCAALIVAHRLSTVRHANHIIVMQRGRVVETGDHDTLWREGGLYRELVRHEG